MGKKLIIPGADFSENCIVIPLTIVVKAGGSVVIGDTTYSAGVEDTQFEIDSIPAGFSITQNNNLKYLRIGSPITLPDGVGLFEKLEEIETVIFAADVNTGAVAKALLANCFKLKNFDGKHLYYNAGNSGSMFYECNSIQEIKNLHFSIPLYDVSYMFKNCYKLETVEFDNSLAFDTTANVTGMFSGCANLKSVIAPSLVASDYNTAGTNTNKFIQGIDVTTGHVTIHCANGGKLTWDSTSWSVS